MQRPGLPRLLVVSSLATSLACGGLLVNPVGLDSVRSALVAVSPESAAPLVAVGAAEAGVFRFCSDALAAYGSVDPSQRQTLFAAMLHEPYPTCPATCGGGVALVDELAGVEPNDRTRTALSRCDAEGPDPVFGGPLAPLRSGMPALEYLVFRALLVELEGKDTRWSDLADEVAVSVVLGARPDLSPTDIVAVEGSFTPPPGAVEALADRLRACDNPHLQHRVIVAPGGGVSAVTPTGCAADLLATLSFPTAGGWAWFDVTWTVPPAAAPQ